MTTIVLKEVAGTVAAAANTTISIPRTATRVTVQVDDVADATVTVSAGNGISGTVDFTNANPANAVTFSGPIASINIAATGSDVDFAVICTGDG